MSDLITSLNWRYATKKFDSTKKLSDEQLEKITESLRLSASSYGLQPWKFVMVKNPETREKLKEVAWNQTQITDASHLFVLCIRKDIDASFVDHFIKSISETRGISEETLKGYSDMMKGTISKLSNDEINQWSARQLYISLGTALASAAFYEIDACPMEGFDNAKFDEILGLSGLGLESKVVLTVGFRSADDETANYKKVRFTKEEVFVEM